MQTKTLIIFTRTPLHIGIGSSVGAVDLPIRRERHTNHPIIPGSSIKGVFRDCARNSNVSEQGIKHLFGPEATKTEDSAAGDLAFNEARPLAFPVRSAQGAFAYITCPFLLKRFSRESGKTSLSELPSLGEQTCYAGSTVVIPQKQRVVLEEYTFTHKGDFPEDWRETLLALSTDPLWKEATKRFVLLTDGDFTHFVSTTTEVSTQTKINPETGVVEKGALFNMECVPSETLFTAPIQIIGRYKETDAENTLDQIVEKNPVMQFGGNSTTGRGFCSVTLQ